MYSSKALLPTTPTSTKLPIPPPQLSLVSEGLATFVTPPAAPPPTPADFSEPSEPPDVLVDVLATNSDLFGPGGQPPTFSNAVRQLSIRGVVYYSIFWWMCSRPTPTSSARGGSLPPSPTRCASWLDMAPLLYY